MDTLKLFLKFLFKTSANSSKEGEGSKHLTHGEFRLELKDNSDTSDVDFLKFTGTLLYSKKFSYANMFDTFTELIEFYETDDGRFVRFWPSTGQMLISKNAEDFIKEGCSGFGMTNSIFTEICKTSDNLIKTDYFVKRI